MQKFLPLYWILPLFLLACGKLEKFARLDEGYTRVYFQQDPRLAAMDGGLMVYFVSTADTDSGRAFGFPDKSAALAKSAVVPNGSYRVYFLGTTGTNKFEGQAKCGRGNGGNPISLSGGIVNVNVDLTATNCGFGTDNEFGKINSANSANSNFDTIDFAFCTGSAYPTCNPATLANYRLRLNMLGGVKPGSGSFLPISGESIQSNCTGPTTSGSITSSLIAFTGGTIFSPPMEILIYSDANCSGGVVGKIDLQNGLKGYYNVASGSNVFVDSPSTSNVTSLKFYFP